MKIDNVIVNKKGVLVDAKRMDWVIVASNHKNKNKIRVSISSGLLQAGNPKLLHLIEDYLFSILQLRLTKNDCVMVVKDVVSFVNKYIDIRIETLVKVECYFNKDLLVYTLLNGKLFEVAININSTKLMLNKNRKIAIDDNYYYNGKRLVKSSIKSLNNETLSTFLYLLQMFD